MFYIKRNYKEGLKLREIFLEVDGNGIVVREIEFDANGKVIHKCPTEGFKNGIYGLFDNVPFDTQELKNDISKEKFDELWNRV